MDKITASTRMELLRKAAREFGSITDNSHWDSNPGVEIALEFAERALAEAAIGYAAEQFSVWLTELAARANVGAVRNLYRRLARAVLDRKWDAQ